MVVLADRRVILFNRRRLTARTTWAIATGYYRSRIVDVGALGARRADDRVGILPVVARSRRSSCRKDEPPDAERRAFLAVLPRPAAFAALHGPQGAYLVDDVRDAGRGAEPDLPRAAALRRRPRCAWSAGAAARAARAAAASPAYLIVDDEAVPARLRTSTRTRPGSRSCRWRTGCSRSTRHDEVGAFGALVVSLALLIGRVSRGRRRPGRPRRGRAAAALVVAWSLAGQISAAAATNTFSRIPARQLPLAAELDRPVGRRRQGALPRAADRRTRQRVWLMEFWNRSLQQVWSLSTAPPPARGRR